MNIPRLHLFENHLQKTLVMMPQSTPVTEAIAQMYQAQTSYVLVTNQQQLAGIITQTDVLRGIANQMTFADMTVGELMSQPVIMVHEAELEDLPKILQRFHQHQIRHLPVLDDQGLVLCVVTPEEVKTAQLEQEVRRREEMSELLLERNTQYQTSETRFNDILNSAIGTCIVSFRVFANFDWEYDYHSVGCETLFGYSSAEFISNKHLWLSHIHPDDVETIIMPGFADIFAAKTFDFEYRFQHKDGSLRWIAATHSSRYDPAADCWVVTATNIDITERKSIEAELRESKHFIEQVISHSPQLLYIFDLITSSNVYLNCQSMEILGYTPAEIQQRGAQFFLEVLHPDDLSVLERNLEYWQNAADGQVLTTECRMKHQDGSWRWLRSREVVFARDENNRPIKILGTTQDITDSKLAEIALHEGEMMLRSIGDNLPNGAVYQVIRQFDGSDRFSYFSAGIERLMEVKAEDVLTDATLLSRQLCAEDIPSFVQAAEESYRYLSVFDTQTRICTPSGVEKWVQLRSTPRQLPDGRVAWDGLIVDVTDIKHAEETLRQSEALLAESQRIARLGNWDYDLVTDTINWSKGLFELFQRDPTLTVASYEEHLQLYHPEDQQKLHQAVELAVSTGQSYKLVLRAFKADGSMMYIHGIGHPQFNSLGKVIRLYGTAQDITEQQVALFERQQAEEKIKASLKEKEVLLKEIHHRVKNNLGIVSSLLQMQCRRIQDPQATAILQDSQNRIASIALAHEKLYRSNDLANIDFAQYIPDLTTHLFDSYNVKSTCIQLSIQVEETSLDIETAIPCGLIINELVSNALKYAFPDNREGEIQVRLCQQSDRTLTLIVRDNGIGLPVEFDSNKTKTLGITLVQGLVKQLRGKLEIQSQSGTEFKISFTTGKV